MKRLYFIQSIFAALLIIGCDANTEQENASYESTDQQNDSLFSKYTVPSGKVAGIVDNIVQDTTPFITTSEAALRIANYKEYMRLLGQELGKPYNPKIDAYGFIFSLENVNLLLDRIRMYNDTVPDTEAITGIRIYKSRKPVLVNEKEILVEEVFMLPTIGIRNFVNIDPDFDPSGENVKTGGDDDDGSVILDASVPCPNQCSTKE